MDTSSNTFWADQLTLENFRDQTSDFLEDMSDEQLRCNLGLGMDQPCSPTTFKCTFGPNSIEFPAASETWLEDMRSACSCGDDLNTEPVGGQGGIIQTPIRDDILASDMYHRKRHMKKQLKLMRIALVGLVLIALYLVFIKR